MNDLGPLSDAALSGYIIRFFRTRNGGQLDDAISSLTVTDWELLHSELEMILKHKGRPPNWIPDATPP